MVNVNRDNVLNSLPWLALAVPLLVGGAWIVFFVGIILVGNYKNWGHQAFAANAVSRIEPASQMDQLFDDCRHYITYGRDSISIWNSVAFFGGRYHLTMQVEVAIESSSKGQMSGQPRFYLNEVGKVSISSSGQVGAEYSNNLEFGPAEWKKVFNANGDFGAIGFAIKGRPVKNFDTFAKACR